MTNDVAKTTLTLDVEENMTGAHGWPLVPSTCFPEEHTLACPRCGSTNITLSVQYGPGGRLGDPGTVEYASCEGCKHDSRRS